MSLRQNFGTLFWSALHAVHMSQALVHSGAIVSMEDIAHLLWHTSTL
jgi:hypothetical protein